MSGLPGLLSRSAAPKIASGPRLGRAVKRAIFVPFRQAALRPGRRKLREAGFVISLGESLCPLVTAGASHVRA